MIDAEITNPETAKPDMPAAKGSRYRNRIQAVAPAIAIAVSRILAGYLFLRISAVAFPAFLQRTPIPQSASPWWINLSHWDAAYFLGIAQQGYPSANVAPFFPGFPLVIKAVHYLSLGILSYPLAAYLVSGISLIASSVLLYALVKRRWGTSAATWSAFLLCWFPTSVFLLAPYPECLGVFLTLLSVWFVTTHRWKAATLTLAFLSCVTPFAVAAICGLFVVGIRRKGFLRSVAMSAGASAGLIAYSLYLMIRFGSPIQYVLSQRIWDRHTTFPFYGTINNILNFPRFVDLVGQNSPFSLANAQIVWGLDDIAGILGFIVVVYFVGLFIRSKVSDFDLMVGIISIVSVLIAVSSSIQYGPIQSTEGLSRQILLAIAVFILPARLAAKYPSLAIIGAGVLAVVAIAGQFMFTNGMWFT